MNDCAVNIGEKNVNKPYTLNERNKAQQPALLLPDIARNKLRSGIAIIRAAYRTPLLRAQAVDHLIDKVRAEYPHAFKRVK